MKRVAGIKAGLALIAAMALASCAAGERVTLMPAAQDRPVGAVAVLGEGGGETVLSEANSQALLNARGARVRQLENVDPAYAELIGSLPRLIEPQVIRYRTDDITIAPEAIANLKAVRDSLGPDLSIYQIEIAGYTDSTGTEQYNLDLSKKRALQVAALLRAEGFEIAQEDVIGRGEYAALREIGDNKSDEQYRAVTIKIR
jgi:outer membrane protein OmpA-like peptidoglycan-associated protein